MVRSLNNSAKTPAHIPSDVNQQNVILGMRGVVFSNGEKDMKAKASSGAT